MKARSPTIGGVSMCVYVCLCVSMCVYVGCCYESLTYSHVCLL